MSERASAAAASAAGLREEPASSEAAPRRTPFLMRVVAHVNVRALLRRVPRAAWVCAFIAFLNAASWAFITPPFQTPDEPDHFAYVKQLAETGTRPTSQANKYSPEEAAVLNDLNFLEVRLDSANHTISTSKAQRKLERTFDQYRRAPSKGSHTAGVAKLEPPLYYALETVPYLIGSGGTLLDRLQLMRLLSALIGGATILFVYMFLRETLPRTRWAWTVGALAAGLSPLFGLMSGAVNPDALLYAVSAALFYCLARGFRRGLSTGSAVATGLVVAIGLVTKLNFIGLFPGALLGLGLIAVRERRRGTPRALRAPLIAAAIALIPAVVFTLNNVLHGYLTFGILSNAIATTHGSLLRQASYIWQLYLPRLPGMTNDFPGLFTTRQIWFDGFVGRLGWLDTFFPGWVYTAALLPALIVAALCIRSLLSGRASLRARIPEFVTYAAVSLGLMVLVGVNSYRIFPSQIASYGQARYLLPLLCLFAALVALAARGAGRRWGPAVGVVIVVLFLAHDLFSQLQVIARYYG